MPGSFYYRGAEKLEDLDNYHNDPLSGFEIDGNSDENEEESEKEKEEVKEKDAADITRTTRPRESLEIGHVDRKSVV